MQACIVAAMATVVVACGQAELTSKESSDVANAELHIINTVIDSSDYAKTLDDVDRLIELYRAKPDATYDGRTMRQVVQDAASTLDEYQLDRAAR
jgi:hypothetical protein